MTTRHEDGSDRSEPTDAPHGRRHGRHHHHHHDHDHDHGHDHHRRRHGRRGGGRPFDYGELRLLVLAMVGEQPRHGYELMKVIEERMGGSYSPSPGVIYPTLAWLEDMGYALAAEEGGRKRYRITEAGETFLAASRPALDDLLARVGQEGAEGGREPVPAPVLRAMENLKLALRLRLRRGAIDRPAAETIAAALDAAAQTIERTE